MKTVLCVFFVLWFVALVHAEGEDEVGEADLKKAAEEPKSSSVQRTALTNECSKRVLLRCLCKAADFMLSRMKQVSRGNEWQKTFGCAEQIDFDRASCTMYIPREANQLSASVFEQAPGRVAEP